MARFLLIAAACVAVSFATPEKRQILLSTGFAAPAAVATVTAAPAIATVTASPIISTVSAAPAIATVAAAPVYSTGAAYNYGLPFYGGLGYGGLGYSGLGYSGLGYSGLGYSGLGYSGLGYNALPYYGYSGLSSYPWASSAVGYPYVNSVATVTGAPLVAAAAPKDTKIAIVNRH